MRQTAGELGTGGELSRSAGKRSVGTVWATPAGRGHLSPQLLAEPAWMRKVDGLDILHINMERIGSGIRLMLNETKEMGLPPPVFKEQSEFVVTFRKAMVTKVVSPGATLWGEEESDFTTDISAVQEQRFALIMHYVREHEQITNREYRELSGVSESTALRDLEALVERRALKRVGKRRGRNYQLP